ncbi:MAG TPA: hypothetical protein VFS00_12245, partial [Polyangiaceae bacterium]|nr:hypothetical protein [Polyangiaceae bacterium]
DVDGEYPYVVLASIDPGAFPKSADPEALPAQGEAADLPSVIILDESKAALPARKHHAPAPQAFGSPSMPSASPGSYPLAPRPGAPPLAQPPATSHLAPRRRSNPSLFLLLFVLFIFAALLSWLLFR